MEQERVLDHSAIAAELEDIANGAVAKQHDRVTRDKELVRTPECPCPIIIRRFPEREIGAKVDCLLVPDAVVTSGNGAHQCVRQFLVHHEDGLLNERFQLARVA